jgi:hypothetical protein
MITLYCENCRKEIKHIQYYRNSDFHENQDRNYFYCGPNCSTEHYEKIL